jgi:hypothetical protein
VTAPSAASSPPYQPAGAAGEVTARGGGVRPATSPDELRARLLHPWPRDVLEARFADLNDLDLFLERYG